MKTVIFTSDLSQVSALIRHTISVFHCNTNYIFMATDRLITKNIELYYNIGDTPIHGVQTTYDSNPGVSFIVEDGSVNHVKKAALTNLN